MKKIVISLIVLLTVVSLYCLPYYKKCKICQSEYSKKHGVTLPSPAWRDFETPIKEKEGKHYAKYKCQYGHSFWVCLED